MDTVISRTPFVKPAIFKVIYRSKIVDEGGHDKIVENIKGILEWSKIWNPKHGITGALLMDEDGFAQVIEGPSNSVKTLFGHIICDRRHRDIQVMEADYHPERDFGDWVMAFVGDHGEADFRLTATTKMPEAPKGGGAKGIIAMLRWFLQEQP